MSIDTTLTIQRGHGSSVGLNCLSALMSIDTFVMKDEKLDEEESQLPFGFDVN